MAGNLTFSIIKPNATQAGLTGKVLDHMLQGGFQLRAMKYLQLTQAQAEAFYAVHRERPFFPNLVEFMTSAPVVVLALEKDNAVEDFRTLIGATNPAEAAEGTIRQLYGENIEANAVHGSDSDENALREIGFFFSKLERF